MEQITIILKNGKEIKLYTSSVAIHRGTSGKIKTINIDYLEGSTELQYIDTSDISAIISDTIVEDLDDEGVQDDMPLLDGDVTDMLRWMNEYSSKHKVDMDVARDEYFKRVNS